MILCSVRFQVCIVLVVLVLPTWITVGEQLIASTTRYWDCSGGVCGCGYISSSGGEAHCHSNALFAAPFNNTYGARFYGTAAVSEALGGDSWLGNACGKCWKVIGTSNIGINSVSTTLVLKGTNFCPPSNVVCSNGRVHFDIAAPGFDFSGASLSNSCSRVESDEVNGFSSCSNWMINSSNPDDNCDCSLFTSDVLRAGCENFLSLQWNNVDVVYEEVACPTELSQLPCWEENGQQWPGQLFGLCEDPGVPLFAPASPEISSPIDDIDVSSSDVSSSDESASDEFASDESASDESASDESASDESASDESASGFTKLPGLGLALLYFLPNFLRF